MCYKTNITTGTGFYNQALSFYGIFCVHLKMIQQFYYAWLHEITKTGGGGGGGLWW
jgi:hypothetical protein